MNPNLVAGRLQYAVDIIFPLLYTLYKRMYVAGSVWFCALENFITALILQMIVHCLNPSSHMQYYRRHFTPPISFQLHSTHSDTIPLSSSIFICIAMLPWVALENTRTYFLNARAPRLVYYEHLIRDKQMTSSKRELFQISVLLFLFHFW